jgi:D-alanyl-lipoteichoic acid acyltransferase DltB (MBOAT superfamily)
MLFNSFDFLVFFPIVTIVYYLLSRQRLRVIWLLLASCYFYMAFIPSYILILAVLIVTDYAAGLFIEKSAGRRRKAFLILSIISNVSFLAFFKYGTFLGENLSALTHFLHLNYSPAVLSVILPIGLSFHTFQSMSYTIEVYRGKQRAEKDFLTYALYVMFYPQLVAGPIERPQNLLPQLKQKHAFDFENIKAGLKFMLWGFFMKLVVADRAGLLVNTVYARPSDYRGFPLLLANYVFAFQIYCDFAGYSVIAIGTARMMGVRLMENFKRPYFSVSPAEFWTRWHISLSTWLRDYLFMPIAVSRRQWGTAGIAFSLMATFLICGLWHGADWTFILWGLLNGLYVLASARVALSQKGRLFRWISWLVTFHAIVLAWTFFRAANIRSAFLVVRNLFAGLLPQLAHPAGLAWTGRMMGPYYMGIDTFDFFVMLLGIVIVGAVDYGAEKQIRPAFFEKPLGRLLGYSTLAVLILLFAAEGSNQFVYFQF